MIAIHDMKKAFKKSYVFESVSFTMTKGEILSIVGPSGTGKSTLLKCLAGLEEMSGGSFYIEEKEMTSIPASIRPVVMMFQQPFLFPHMTVLDNVMYGLKFQKRSKKENTAKARSFLAKVNLSDYENFMPYELSGGQQQRVALARALVTSPSLLLLDEPFSSLDNALRQETRDWVKRLLKEQNTTAIFVTHDIEEAMIMGDRVSVFGEGRLQQIGDPSDIYYHPKSTFVAEFYSDGFMLDPSTFVHTEKLHVIKHGETHARSWSATILNKRMKHGRVFYDIKLADNQKHVTILAEDIYQVGEKLLIGIVKEEDVITVE
ncbi:iron(III) transport system ATP-binding protein/sulfate transport system ATP-binding protein/putative spermidine/putrescine transport system ATP-binding protein [Bacillus tianshenii]|uniref:Iron(III) transport system ATP-binding protein/sulfate transport system ATP-binding protein/putative spermidine/putrescine transport system ATP-binding protein n=1 Tax=Sutcliffiella tianshenii TaxID=1463404 RepID=A0ABS2NYJ0_9BACI|nr:ABC transporter ATP-binding protein [Bacillus tianshenii]MBM7619702.1 iron(III) transport system ATP-binding protein/sulfate transport system ATP-binding protein/putative spermidine/putrescine transport system ATP-binding protein [Bacillus tianshenii]